MQPPRETSRHAHEILRNRIYLGEISLRGTWHPGVHPAIIDQALWDQVHALLGREPRERALETHTRGRSDALLRGLLFGRDGERMAPTYTNKKGQIYRYYVALAERRYGVSANTTLRIPALELEAATVAQIKTVLSSPEAIAAVCQKIAASGTTLDEPQIVLALSRLGDIWEQLYPNEQHQIVQLMIERVDLVPDGLRIRWRELGWKELITEFAPDSIGAELVELEEVA